MAYGPASLATKIFYCCTVSSLLLFDFLSCRAVHVFEDKVESHGDRMRGLSSVAVGILSRIALYASEHQPAAPNERLICSSSEGTTSQLHRIVKREKPRNCYLFASRLIASHVPSNHPFVGPFLDQTIFVHRQAVYPRRNCAATPAGRPPCSSAENIGVAASLGDHL